jgi:IS30 family transposase
MEDLTDFEREQIICACLAGASVTKIATLLGVSGATVSNVMLPNTNHGKTSAKINIDRKRSFYIEKVGSEKSHNYCSIGNRKAKLNIDLEVPVSTKTV